MYTLVITHVVDSRDCDDDGGFVACAGCGKKRRYFSNIGEVHCTVHLWTCDDQTSKFFFDLFFTGFLNAI